MLQHHIRHEAIYVDRPAFAGRYSNQRCMHLQRTLNERPANAGNGILHGVLSLQERRTYFFFAECIGVVWNSKNKISIIDVLEIVHKCIVGK